MTVEVEIAARLFASESRKLGTLFYILDSLHPLVYRAQVSVKKVYHHSGENVQCYFSEKNYPVL